MSIIERSLEKLGAARARGEAASPAASGKSARNAYSKARMEPARAFQSAQLDAVALEANKILSDRSDPRAMAAYNIVRTRLLQRLAGNDWQSIAVTGSQPGEGKSLTAINLAIALARDANTSVFLVDMDLKRPSIAAQLGMSFDKGLSDYLAGDAKLEEIIYDPGVARLSIVPNAVAAAAPPSELLGSARMHELVEFLRAEVPRRVIIYDMPPLMMSDDVLTFAPKVDGLLFVVTEGTTDRKALSAARHVLSEMNLIGVVLNRATSGDKHSSSYY